MTLLPQPPIICTNMFANKALNTPKVGAFKPHQPTTIDGHSGRGFYKRTCLSEMTFAYFQHYFSCFIFFIYMYMQPIRGDSPLGKTRYAETHLDLSWRASSLRRNWAHFLTKPCADW